MTEMWQQLEIKINEGFFFSNDFDGGYLYMGFKIEEHEQEPAKGTS